MEISRDAIDDMKSLSGSDRSVAKKIINNLQNYQSKTVMGNEQVSSGSLRIRHKGGEILRVFKKGNHKNTKDCI